MVSFEPLWRLFRFPSPEMEQQYRKSQVHTQQFFTIVWCATLLLSCGYLLLRHIDADMPISIFAFPGAVLLLVAILNLGIRRLQPYMLVVLSIAMAATCAWGSLLAARQIDGVLQHLRSNSMDLVWEAVESNPAAKQQLEQNLLLLVSDSTMGQTLFSLLGLCGATVCAGLHLSTLAGVLLVAPFFFGGLALQGYHMLNPIFVTYMTSILVWFVFVALGVAHFRRSRFESEYRFETQLAESIEASRKADSILNHTLKNTMADASTCLELYLAALGDTVSSGVGHLRRSQECLRRGMMNCHNRETYLKLSSGTYRPLCSTVQLAAFANDLVTGRAVTRRVVALTVQIDPVTCGLVLENALTNALRHADPANPDVQLVIEEIPASEHSPVDPTDPRADRLGPPTDRRRPSHASSRYSVCSSTTGHSARTLLHFHLSNRANPAEPPLDEARVALLLKGEGARPTQKISDHLGLQHIRLGAEAQGMAFTLRPDGDRVVFEAELWVTKLLQPQGRSSTNVGGEGLGVFPSGLCFCCVDDSPSQRRLLDHAINTHLHTSAGRMLRKWRSSWRRSWKTGTWPSLTSTSSSAGPSVTRALI